LVAVKSSARLDATGEDDASGEEDAPVATATTTSTRRREETSGDVEEGVLAMGADLRGPRESGALAGRDLPSLAALAPDALARAGFRSADASGAGNDAKCDAMTRLTAFDLTGVTATDVRDADCAARACGDSCILKKSDKAPHSRRSARSDAVGNRFEAVCSAPGFDFDAVPGFEPSSPNRRNFYSSLQRVDPSVKRVQPIATYFRELTRVMTQR
jgi:hypothetical protein